MAPTWDSGPARRQADGGPMASPREPCCGQSGREGPARSLCSAPVAQLVASERGPPAPRAVVTPQPGLLRHAALGQLWHREKACCFWWVSTSRVAGQAGQGPDRSFVPAGHSGQLPWERGSNAGVRDVGTSGSAVFRSGRRPYGFVFVALSSPWGVSCLIGDVDGLMARCWAASRQAPVVPQLLSPPAGEKCSGRRVWPGDQGCRVWGSPE